jgi:hypothetical protein
MNDLIATDVRAISPINFDNKTQYIYDIDNILLANTGRLDALDSNRFFQEAGQMLINAVNLFEMGYFDCAFYSLRQALEVSIGTLYLTANREKVKSWNRQEKGFESGTMYTFLKDNEPAFKDMQDKMKDYFSKIRKTKLFIDKYVHKQGYKTFYSVRKSFDYENKLPVEQLISDFEMCLSDCIGAVAIYRLAIDPMPLLLMDEDIDRRTMQMMAEAFSEEFVDKYIGDEVVNTYKETEIYKTVYEHFSQFERQNDDVYNVIHLQFVERSKLEQIASQAHLLTWHNRIAVGLFYLSDKISNVYLMDGFDWYFSDVKSKRSNTTVTFGNSFYQEFFKTENNYNESFQEVFLSRCRINNETHYIEHNEPLNYSEVMLINHFAATMDNNISEAERELQEWFAQATIPT